MNCHPTFCGMLVEVQGRKLKAVKGQSEQSGFSLRAWPQQFKDAQPFMDASPF